MNKAVSKHMDVSVVQKSMANGVEDSSDRLAQGWTRKIELTQVYPRQIINPITNILGWGDARTSEPSFLEALSAYLGSDRRVIPVGRARSGIYIIVKHAISSGRSEVIMSPYTIPDVVNMVSFAGGTPIFVDFPPNSTNVSVDSIEKAITARTAAVILTHYHVNQNHLADILHLCRSRSILLFDDCAIAFGSRYKGSPIGAHTDASVMSFSSFKLLNYFWGGALSIRSPEMFASIERDIETWPRLRMVQYKTQAVKTLIYDLATSKALFPLVYRLRLPRAIGRRIDDVFPLSRVETKSLDATITSRPHLNAFLEWNQKFPTLTSGVARRRSLASIYDQYFRDICVSAETPDALRSESCFVNYPVVVGVHHRDEIYREMLRSGFDIGLSLYPNAHEVETFRHIKGHSANVSTLARSVLTLPTHGRIRPDYAHKLARRFAELLAARPDGTSSMVSR